MMMVPDKRKEVERIKLSIKKLKVQGATEVMKAGVKAYLLNPTRRNAKAIESLRPTEPLLQNALKMLSRSEDKNEDAKAFLKEVDTSHEKISRTGSRLIKGDMNVFSHCHSSTVMGILKKAKEMRRRFVVYTLQVNPRLQGRISAKELATAGIDVITGPDLAAEHMIPGCDIVLFGADAFDSKNIYNKIGTRTICEIAKRNNIPVYCCATSLKYSKKKVKLEKRNPKEVWDERNKKIKVVYPAFDRVPYRLIDGIISEEGILSAKSFVRSAKKKVKGLNKKV